MNKAISSRFNHNSVFFYILAIFLLTLPYNISSWWVGTFSFALALTTLSNPSKRVSLHSLFQEKTFQALVVFIFFTYISVLWSQSPDIFNGDLKTNIGRFKYFFLIVPAIYLSNLTRKDIKILLIVIALAPSLSILIYYTNYFGLSNIFPAQNQNSDLILRHYLRQNFFILFSILYLYIYIFATIKKGDYIKLFIYLPLLLVTCLSLVIDERTDSRLIDLAFILILIIIPFYYLKPKTYFSLITILLISSAVIINNSPAFKTGIKNFDNAIQSDTYSGSWGHRLGYAIVGIEIFKDNPIFGRGINDVTRPIEIAFKDHPNYFIGENLRYFHNEHINILVATGIVGYSLLLYFLLIFFRLKTSDKKIHIFKNTTIIIFLFTMMGDHYLSVKSTINFFFIFMALIITYKSIDNEQAKQST